MSVYGSRPGPAADFWHGVTNSLILMILAVCAILILLRLV